ncbi:uncharacterized protein EI97DRAFT_437182 [Westerdykella ornata]|uniref:Uncharacterized protein n=1 Tax=Westerdykella ornata TaxID=318751 RepID=A0A6A6J6J0_WESOR|nr:uncharacterized protein EI97DRAFT_437182 [Westerdykella ornata]KAF2272191.1 hypothetical protein EI97DRAFT_437182 [Westerdykella ornata]
MTPVNLPRAESDKVASPFLRLAGEIRNKIYELALTSPNKQLVYLDKPLASKPGLYNATMTIPNDGRGFVEPSFLDTVNSAREFNQLKLVCRQLHNETAGLEVRFNTIVWMGCTPLSKRVRGDLPSKLPPSWEQNLHTLVMRPPTFQRLGGSLDDISKVGSYFHPDGANARFVCSVLDFCCKYPNVKVAWVMEGFFVESALLNDFVSVADAICTVVRGPSTSELSHYRGAFLTTWLSGQVAVYAKTAREQGHSFANLRIYPEGKYFPRFASTYRHLFPGVPSNALPNLLGWDPKKMDREIHQVYRAGV